MKCLREKIRNKENIGRILIGGDFSGLNSLGFYEDFIYLPDIPFRQGFREINILELRKEYLKYKEAHPDKVVRLRGQFYSDPNCKEPTYLNEPCVHFEIENYKLN